MPVFALLERLMNRNAMDMVVHFGDIAYATGYLSEWENFFHMVEPVASRIPWQASLGNHESGWSGSMPLLDTFTDSGGECSVPYLAHFPLGTTSVMKGGVKLPLKNRTAWYSFKYGNAHVVMLDTEHEWARGTPQYAWLRRDLESVDRGVTPWLIVTMHRPLLIASDWQGDQDVAASLQKELMPLMEAHGVDIVLYGHHHSYQRMCKFSKGECVPEDSSEGLWPFTLGMAGYPLNRYPIPTMPYAVKVDTIHYGVGLLDLPNATHAHLSFVAIDDSVLDDVWMTRPDTAHGRSRVAWV